MDKYRVRLPIEQLVMAFGPEKMSSRRSKRDKDEPSVISVMDIEINDRGGQRRPL